ncbi:hypothetical protein [Croceibacterium aestuarii]|uniref:hypothetical protein n=1 Tax=Croceibacterium aestuarii TaxID=3064139 RepID=UPI00272E07FF|nr:hypothetical protein [Croceibacterium sp. D39]
MAESFAELLDKRKRTAIAIFHRFRLEVAAGLDHVLFVEGFEDLAFYSRFLPLGSFRPEAVRMTFGKRNMDRIVGLYYAEGLDSRCEARFIRDADFDEFLGNLPAGERVVILDRYSVENFIFTPSNFEMLLAARFGISADEYDIPACITRYENGVRQIFQHLAPLFGASFAAIENGHSLDFNSLDVRNIASVFFATGDLSELTDEDYTRCRIPLEFRTEESAQRGRSFVEREPFLWLRGHYLALICSAYVQRTHDTLCAKRTAGEIHTLNPNLSTDFSAAALAERMGAFCEAPTILQDLAA